MLLVDITVTTFFFNHVLSHHEQIRFQPSLFWLSEVFVPSIMSHVKVSLDINLRSKTGTNEGVKQLVFQTEAFLRWKYIAQRIRFKTWNHYVISLGQPYLNKNGNLPKSSFFPPHSLLMLSFWSTLILTAQVKRESLSSDKALLTIRLSFQPRPGYSYTYCTTHEAFPSPWDDIRCLHHLVWWRPFMCLSVYRCVLGQRKEPEGQWCWRSRSWRPAWNSEPVWESGRTYFVQAVNFIKASLVFDWFHMPSF